MGPIGCPETSVENYHYSLRNVPEERSFGFLWFRVELKDSWTLRMGPIGCPETSVRNYHYSLRNNPEERSSRLLRGGSLKSRRVVPVHAIKKWRRSTGTAPLIFNVGTICMLVVNFTPRPLETRGGKKPSAPTKYETGWAPKSVSETLFCSLLKLSAMQSRLPR
jgi:hypothetical protein